METPTAGYRRQNHNSAARTLAASRVCVCVCVCVCKRERQRAGILGKGTTKEGTGVLLR